MPVYEYVCQECRTRHDVRHGFEESAGACPACGGVLERVFHVGGIHFKGSGFYTTDYKRSNSAGASGSSSDSSAAKSDSSAAKSDSGAAKSESSSAGKTSEKSA